jgi:hypothetical protein
VGCCECGDEPSGSGTTQLVIGTVCVYLITYVPVTSQLIDFYLKV